MTPKPRSTSVSAFTQWLPHRCTARMYAFKTVGPSDVKKHCNGHDSEHTTAFMLECEHIGMRTTLNLS